jgi:hypothetical protein
MTNTMSKTDVLTRAKLILQMSGYFIVETSDKDPLINLVAVNEKHTLLIRIKDTKSKSKSINQIVKENRADLKTLFHIPKSDNVYVMFWVWFDSGDEWQRYLIDRGGNLLEVYEAL